MQKKESEKIASLISDKTFDMSPDEIQDLGYRSIDLIKDYFQTIRKAPVLQEQTFDQLHQLLDEAVPKIGQNPDEVLKEFQTKIIPNTIKIGNPYLLGWILSSGTVIGSFADGLASAINQNVAVSGSGVATAVELVVLKWIKEILGYDSKAAGLLVSGGSIANLLGLAVARNVKANYEISKNGIQHNNMILYASKEAHVCISKAVNILGLGTEHIRWINVDDKLCLDVEDLQEKIIEDQTTNDFPFAVVATAGTVNIGAIDPLDIIADICRKNNLWFHVDAAYGGFAALSPNLKPMLHGLYRADSIAINPHKWLFIPYEAGCILIKNSDHMKKTFSAPTDYIHLDNTSSNTNIDFSEYGIQLSRSFRALKIWMSLKQYGAIKYGEIIEQNVNLAKYLAALIEESADFRLIASPTLSIVCFQYCPSHLERQNMQQRTESSISKLNSEIIKLMRKDRRVQLSSTKIKNKVVLRACIINYRTTKNDIITILKVIRELGEIAKNKMIL